MAIAEKDHVRKESKPVVGGLPVTLSIQAPPPLLSEKAAGCTAPGAGQQQESMRRTGAALALVAIERGPTGLRAPSAREQEPNSHPRRSRGKAPPPPASHGGTKTPPHESWWSWPAVLMATARARALRVRREAPPAFRRSKGFPNPKGEVVRTYEEASVARCCLPLCEEAAGGGALPPATRVIVGGALVVRLERRIRNAWTTFDRRRRQIKNDFLSWLYPATSA